MNEEIRALLFLIVERFATTDEHRTIERNAGAQPLGVDLDDEKQEATAREHDVAEEQADAFARGLQLAHARYRDGEQVISLDDRDAGENAMASALIDYLVRFDLADSKTREIAQQHYVYDITVDWSRLQELLTARDLRLDDLFDSPTE